MSKCKVCGFRLNEGVPKCPTCGAMRGSLQAGKINPASNLLIYSCPSCKAEIIGEHRYCSHCGIELKEAAKKARSINYPNFKKNMPVWVVLGIVVLTILGSIFLWSQRKEERNNNEKLTYAEQESMIDSKPTKDNATTVSREVKETPLEAFKYEIRGGKYILTGLKDNSLTAIVIPIAFSEIKGKVDKNGNGVSVFAACKKLNSVIIPNSVIKIGEHSFRYCHNLTNVTIPNSVTKIRKSAFSHCYSLTNMSIPNSVTKIERSVFSDCHSLTNITIPNSVTKIGEYTFYDCLSLTNVTIPDSVTKIGLSVFSGCHSLTNITIPNSVTEIGAGAFHFCSNLTDITIPNSVTEIEYFAFWGCKSLTSITIPASVTKIGTEAFSFCESLTNLTIPASVTEIGEYAFSSCYSLENVTIGSPTFKESDIKRVFGDSPSFTEVKIGNKVVYLN